jgi:hypothetical protein
VIERLDFRLPRFCRYLWVSVEAREHWAPRLAELAARLESLALARIAAPGGARICDPAPSEVAGLRARASEHGLCTLRLPCRDEIAPHLDNPTLVATPATAERLTRAWHGGDVQAWLAGLELPACCARAYIERHIEQRWRDGAFVTLADAPEEIEAPPALNRLLARIGLHALEHDPCGPSCPGSLALGERHLGFLRERDAATADALLQILGWPMEWSALHGAVELRTPVVKLCWDSDPTASPRAVIRRRAGATWPVHAAVGQRFPYRPPARHRLLASIGWRRGLDHTERSS